MQWTFAIEGIPAIALGVVVCLCLARSPSEASFLSLEERDWLASRLVTLAFCNYLAY